MMTYYRFIDINYNSFNYNNYVVAYQQNKHSFQNYHLKIEKYHNNTKVLTHKAHKHVRMHHYPKACLVQCFSVKSIIMKEFILYRHIII